ncbi:methyltransferase [Hydrogenimonas sp.]
MAAHKEFRRFAASYGRYNLIQARVARALVSKIDRPYPIVVDLGCGSGGLFQAYEQPFTKYWAIDAAPEMLALHPSDPRVEKMVGNFDDASLFETLETLDFDLLVSSSALQWSADLDWTLERISSLKRPAAMAIFTSGTFASLRRVTGTPSPIRSARETIDLLERHFDATIDILHYRLYFRDTLSMLRYIKRSGVSGGERHLPYGAIKRVIENYRLPYLEFEVVRAMTRAIR